MFLLRLYPIVILVNITVLALIYLFIPTLRFQLVAEDQFLENLTAILYFDAFLLGLFFWTQIKRKKLYWVCTLIPLLSLLAFLDEISFGQRLFDLKMPVIGNTRIDGIHDFVSLAKSQMSQTLYVLNSQFPSIYSALVIFSKISILVVVGLVAFFAIQKRQEILSGCSNFLRKYPPFQFVMYTAGFGFVSQLVDLEFIQHHFLLFIEEAFEMNMALTMLFASFAIRRLRASDSNQEAIADQLQGASGEA